MRGLSDGAVLARGGEILKRVMPHFLNGGPGYVADAVNPLMEQLTHFFEEANLRALDAKNPEKLTQTISPGRVGVEEARPSTAGRWKH